LLSQSSPPRAVRPPRFSHLRWNLSRSLLAERHMPSVVRAVCDQTNAPSATTPASVLCPLPVSPFLTGRFFEASCISMLWEGGWLPKIAADRHRSHRGAAAALGKDRSAGQKSQRRPRGEMPARLLTNRLILHGDCLNTFGQRMDFRLEKRVFEKCSRRESTRSATDDDEAGW